ncbi:MAG: S8 family serine peptidase [Cytophagaceae bacterium]
MSFIKYFIFAALAICVVWSCSKKQDPMPVSDNHAPVEEPIMEPEPVATVPPPSTGSGTDTSNPWISGNMCPEESDATARTAFIQDEYIVVLENASKNQRMGNSHDRMRDVMRRANISTGSVHDYYERITGFSARMSADQARQLADDPEVAFVEPDFILSLQQEDVNVETLTSTQHIPWGIRRVGGAGNGKGKTAWIMDSGIDMNHPDLAIDKRRSKSFVEGIESPDDDNGHGTHVAGTIAALDNGIGVVGVAAGATVISVKVMNSEGKGRVSAIIKGIDYVAANGKAGDVVNFSIGGAGISQSLERAVINASSKGIYFAMAAGNDAEYACRNSPQRLNGNFLYTISAIDSTDRFARFSNFGNGPVDFAAPGVRVLSTWPGGKYAYSSGTSMAAPHAAGLMLLNGSNIKTSGFVRNDPDGVADPIAHR